MMYQFHWEFCSRNDEDNPTIFVAERDINSKEEMQKFIQEVRLNNFPPNGYTAMICNSKSKHFIKNISF